MRAALFLIIALFVIAAATTVNSTYSSTDTIVINEVELNPTGTDIGSERVELYNPTSSAIDVTGWTLSSTAGRTATVTLDRIIAAGEYHVVSMDSKWLDNEGETVVLRTDRDALAESAGPFSDNDNDARTWQRSPDGSDSWIFVSATLGQRNAGTTQSGSGQQSSESPASESEEPKPAPRIDSSVEVTPEIVPNGNLTIVFIDVGQGDSSLIILPNRNTILIDGGDYDSSDEVILAAEKWGVTKIDLVIATHPHADHIGGLVDIMRNIRVGQVMDSGQIHTTKTFEDLLDYLEAQQVPLSSLREGDQINLDATVRIEVLNPPVTLVDGANNEEEFNDNSVVIKLTYGEFSALFTGDMEHQNEVRLAQEIGEQGLDVDVLKAGHHGSRTSSTSEFLNAITPQVVVISSGADNSYGHPHKEALNRIETAGVQHVFRTDLDGTIILTSDGSDDYTIETVESNKAVVVPEFDIAIIIAAISMMSLIVAVRGRILWRQSGPA